MGDAMSRGPAWSGVLPVATRQDFDRFFRRLDAASRNPIVVLTIRDGEQEPLVPVDDLAGQIGDAAEIVALSPDATFWLTDRLGDRMLSVHSGWSRVYPPSPDWRTNPHLAPRFAPPLMRDRRRIVEQIVAAVLSAAYRGGGFSAEPAPAGAVSTIAVVKGVLSPTQVLVETAEGKQAVMQTHRLALGVRAERLVRKGQRFEGRVLHPHGQLWGEFSPDPVVDNAERRAREFAGAGIVTSGLVAGISRGSIRVLLHPDIEVQISRGEGEDLTSMAGEGDVVTVEVVPLDEGYLADFSGDEPAPAMSLLPGGPPWLLPEDEGRMEPSAAPAEAGETLDESPAGMSGDAVAALEELEQTQRRLDQAERIIRDLRRELRVTRRVSLPKVYTDAESQLRLELWLAYLTNVGEADRGAYPWPARFRVARSFIDTADQLIRSGGITRERIVLVCAEVICGWAKNIPNRNVKPWMDPSDGKPETRARDRAVAMRVRLQVGAHAARRLKYWQMPSGEIELDSVGVHDEGI